MNNRDITQLFKGMSSSYTSSYLESPDIRNQFSTRTFSSADFAEVVDTLSQVAERKKERREGIYVFKALVDMEETIGSKQIKIYKGEELSIDSENHDWITLNILIEDEDGLLMPKTYILSKDDDENDTINLECFERKFYPFPEVKAHE